VLRSEALRTGQVLGDEFTPSFEGAANAASGLLDLLRDNAGAIESAADDFLRLAHVVPGLQTLADAVEVLRARGQAEANTIDAVRGKLETLNKKRKQAVQVAQVQRQTGVKETTVLETQIGAYEDLVAKVETFAARLEEGSQARQTAVDAVQDYRREIRRLQGRLDALKGQSQSASRSILDMAPAVMQVRGEMKLLDDSQPTLGQWLNPGEVRSMAGAVQRVRTETKLLKQEAPDLQARLNLDLATGNVRNISAALRGGLINSIGRADRALQGLDKAFEQATSPAKRRRIEQLRQKMQEHKLEMQKTAGATVKAEERKREARKKTLARQVKGTAQQIQSAEQAGQAVIGSIKKQVQAYIAKTIASAVSSLGPAAPIVGPALGASIFGLFNSLLSGLIPGFARGGEVRGPGGPRDDEVPIMASDGEHVINAKSAQAAPNLVRRINRSPQEARRIEEQSRTPDAPRSVTAPSRRKGGGAGRVEKQLAGVEAAVREQTEAMQEGGGSGPTFDPFIFQEELENFEV